MKPRIYLASVTLALATLPASLAFHAQEHAAVAAMAGISILLDLSQYRRIPV